MIDQWITYFGKDNKVRNEFGLLLKLTMYPHSSSFVTEERDRCKVQVFPVAQRNSPSQTWQRAGLHR